MFEFFSENECLAYDIDNILNENAISWKEFKDASVFITGATGLIGSLLAKTIFYANEKFKLNLKLILLVKNSKKLNNVIDEKILISNSVTIIQEYQIEQIEKIDYVFHCASLTQSTAFVCQPVDVINTNFFLTEKILSKCTRSNIKSFVYLSTMEVYGVFDKEVCVKEDTFGYINPLDSRSSYSLSKKAVENLCYSYYSQFFVPIKIARLTLTFGPGVGVQDNRVFSQFSKSVIHSNDIILHTDGATKRDYLYTADAVSGLLILLLNGKAGHAYNLANPRTYMSILDMANLVSRLPEANNKICVKIKKPVDIKKYGYSPENKISLNITAMGDIGWKPSVDLDEMFTRLIKYLKSIY